MSNMEIETIHSLNTKKSTPMAGFIAATHITAIASSVILGELAFRLSIFASMPISVLIIIFVGTRFRAINNMSHECCHSTYATSKSVNDFFGHIFAIFELSSFRVVRLEHATHHQHLGDYDRDLDFKDLKRFEFHKEITRSSLKQHITNAILCRHLREYLFVRLIDQTEPLWAKCARTLVLIAVFVAFVFYPLSVSAFLIAPFLTTYRMHKYLTDYIDHGGLLNERVAMRKTRNFVLKNAILRYIFFPRTDCYHLVHHLFPFLSVESLPLTHRFLMRTVPAYAAMTHDADAQIEAWLRLA
ncbi:fatty acid desaturase family protein [Trinickia sp.]|uniref:fatty acid desaturase family protein n=1 Tax=Trinickia sp. TaxID=2571163 RepID=UPI003F7E5DF7